MTTILLKILIPDHLYVLHHYRRGPSPGPRSHLLTDTLGEGRYRLGERPTCHDVYPHLVRIDDHARYLLARPVSRDLHEAPDRQRVNPVGGEGRLRGGPRQLQIVVGQGSLVYLSVQSCLPDSLFLLGLLLLLELALAPLLLLLALLLREEHVVDGDVDLCDVEAH